MFYCDVGILDPYDAINKELALNETVKHIRKKIGNFDSCNSAAIEFVKFYTEYIYNFSFFTENEIEKIARSGAGVCLSGKKTKKMNLEETIKIYLDIYNFIYNEMKNKYKDIILENKPKINKSVQRVKVKKVRK